MGAPYPRARASYDGISMVMALRSFSQRARYALRAGTASERMTCIEIRVGGYHYRVLKLIRYNPLSPIERMTSLIHKTSIYHLLNIRHHRHH